MFFFGWAAAAAAYRFLLKQPNKKKTWEETTLIIIIIGGHWCSLARRRQMFGKNLIPIWKWICCSVKKWPPFFFRRDSRRANNKDYKGPFRWARWNGIFGLGFRHTCIEWHMGGRAGRVRMMGVVARVDWMRRRIVGYFPGDERYDQLGSAKRLGKCVTDSGNRLGEMRFIVCCRTKKFFV